MEVSQPVFFPIDSNYSAQNIFAKRQSLNKRCIKTYMSKSECMVDDQRPIQMYDTYSRIKRRL